MSTVSLEEVLEEVKALPSDSRQQLYEVLENQELSQILWEVFALTVIALLEKENSLIPGEQKKIRDALGHGALDSVLVGKASLVRAVRGKYAHLSVSSDAFAAQKQEEIELEDRR
ncbi:MAG: hypothetical protein LC754_19575 [Acidobacteria bacterium]|nr:hypothetical protein [Acidobacteriota bacterium]